MLTHDDTARGRPAVWSGLVGAGVASVGGYAWLAFGLDTGNSWPLLHRFMAVLGALGVLQFVAWSCALRLPDTRALVGVVFAFALACRALVLFAGLETPRGPALTDDLTGRAVGYEKFLLYDNDVWRFLWDGHVASTGTSPYRYSPAEIGDDDALESRFLDSERWWDVYDNVSFERLVTVYPPLAQAVFALAGLVAPGSVFVWKTLLAGLDLALCWLLLTMLRHGGGAVGHCILYAWSPLVIKEVAGSGHVESLTTLLLLAGVWLALRGAPRRAVALTVAAALTKLAPIVALPLVVRRAGRRHVVWALLLAAALCLPFIATLPRWLETVRVFAERWRFNAGPWALLEAAFSPLTGNHSESLASWASLALLSAAVGLAWRRARPDGPALDLYGAVFAVLAAATLLAPAVMPWYLIWALPFAVLLSALGRGALARRIGPLWALLCCLSLSSYYFYAEQTEFAWWRWVEYGVPALLAIVAGRKR